MNTVALSHVITKRLRPEGDPKPFTVWFELSHQQPVKQKGVLSVQFGGHTFKTRVKVPGKPKGADRATRYVEVDTPDQPGPGSAFSWSFDKQKGEGQFSEKFEDLSGSPRDNA